MSSFDVGTAFIRILPDTREFAALLRAQVNAAVTSAVPISGGVAGATNASAAATGRLSTATATAAAQTTALSSATTIAAGANAKEAAAALSLSRALDTEATALARVTKLQTAGASAAQITAAQNKALIASQAVQVAQLRKLEAGMAGTALQSKIAQGSIVGLSRITPVAVFGLGVAGSAAIAAGLALKGSINAFADFEQQLNTFQAVSKATAGEMQLVRDTAIALGADITLPAVSAGDASVALTELSKAGLSVRDSLDAARGVLQLSSAASISAGEAAQITATQLNAFQLAGSDATRVAELLADASVSAQGEITDFAAGFGQVAAVANQVGLSIEDTTGLLTQLGKAGLQGSDGGTSLRTALLRLVPTTKEARAYTEALGIQIDKTKSIGSQIIPIIEQYRTQLQKLTPVQQQEVLTQIFGQDAIRAASILFTQQQGALKDLTDEFARNNSIQDLSAAKAKGLKGAIGSLQGQMETLGIQVGGVIEGPLTLLVKGFSDIAGGASGAISSLEDFGVALDGAFGKENEGKLRSFFGTFAEFNIGPGAITNTVEKIRAPFKQIEEAQKQAMAEFEAALASQRQTFTPNLFGGFDFTASVGVDESRTAVTKAAAAALPKLDPKLAAALEEINRLQEDQANQVSLAIAVPRSLQQNLIDAQINDSLQQELRADNAIVAFFEKRLGNLKEGTEKFLVVSGQLLDAQQQRDAVVEQINSNQKAANQTAKQNADEAVRLAKERDAAEEQLRQTIIDIQTQKLSNQLQLAQSTPGTADEKKVFQAQIALFERQRKQAQKIRDAASSSVQEQKDAQLQIERLNGQIIATKLQMKNLGKDPSGGGFTLNQLFQEAVDQFTTFGSNIAGRNGILSPQGARGSLGRSILEQLGNAQLTEAQKQTSILALINGKLPARGAGVGTQTRAQKNQYEWASAREAAFYGYTAG